MISFRRLTTYRRGSAPKFQVMVSAYLQCFSPEEIKNKVINHYDSLYDLFKVPKYIFVIGSRYAKELIVSRLMQSRGNKEMGIYYNSFFMISFELLTDLFERDMVLVFHSAF